MKFKSLFFASLLVFVAACQKSDINQDEDDFSNPQQVSEEVSRSKVADSSFEAIPSAESLSNNLFVPDRINFAFDSAAISSTQKEILDAQASFIKENISLIQKIKIAGYADQRGTIEYNYALGERRANAVKKYFVSKNISANLIEVISYGKEVVLVEGSSEEAYRQNRISKTNLCENKNC